MELKRMTVTMGRKFVPPGGDRFQPHEVTVSIDVSPEPGETQEMVGLALRQIVKEQLTQAMKEESL